MKIHYYLRKLLACLAVTAACTCGTAGSYAADTYLLNGTETAWPSSAIRPSWRAYGNEIIINGIESSGTWVDGCLIDETAKSASGNTITITDSNISLIRGGVNSSGAAENNTVTVTDSTIEGGTYGSIMGGSGGGAGATSGNTVTVVGSTIKGDVVGGKNSDNKVHSITNNTVTATDSALEGSYLYGGYSQSQQEGTVVSGNRVELTNSSHGNYIHGGSASGAGMVTDNHVIVTGGTSTNSGHLYGGSSTGGTLKGNTVTLQDGTSGWAAYGARSSGSSAVAQAESNAVVIKNSTFSSATSVSSYSPSKIYGTSIEANNSTGDISKALNNSVTIEGSTVYAFIYGAYTKGLSELSGNSVTITNSTVACGSDGIYGAWNQYTGIATNNSVTMTGSTVTANVYGSYTASASKKNASEGTNNTITIEDCTLTGTVYGGYIWSGGIAAVSDNHIRITDTTVTGAVYGACIYEGDATGNDVQISSSAVTSNVIGGYAYYGNATGNDVQLTAATVTNSVFGGYARNGNATGNTVTIQSGSDLSAANVYGGYSYSGGDVSGNTLNIEGYKGTIKSLQNFETVNILGACEITTENLKLTDGATFLTNADAQLSVTGTLTLNGTCTISMEGLSNLNTGSYTLLSYGTISDTAVWTLDATGGNTLLTYTLDASKAGELCLLVERNGTAVLTWDSSLTGGIWSEDDSVGSLWNSEGGSLSFKADDNVVFEGGEVTIQGEVKPADIWVQGNADTTFSGEGSITGDAGLEKNGTGTLTINNANSYTGTTTVNAGALVLNHANALGTGAVSVNGGTLRVAVSTTLAGGISASGTGVVSLEGAGTTLTGDVSLSGSSQLSVEAGALLTGSLTVASDTAKVKVEASKDFIDSHEWASPLVITSGTVDWSTSGLSDGGDIVVLGDIFNGYRTTVTVDETSGISLSIDSRVLLLDNSKTGVWETGGSDELWLNIPSVDEQSDTQGSDTFMNNDTVVINTSLENTDAVVLSVGGEVRAAEVLIQGDQNLTITQADGRAEANIGGVDTALVKEGAGTTTIETANSFGGGLTVKEGSIVAKNNEALGKSTVTMQNGTTLIIDEKVAVANTVVVTASNGTGSESTIVNPDAVELIVQEKGTNVAAGEAGAEDIILSVGQAYAVIEQGADVPQKRMKLGGRNGGQLGSGATWAPTDTQTEHNLVFDGGTLLLTAADEAFTVNGKTTVNSTHSSTIDLSTWNIIPEGKDVNVIYCLGGLDGGENAYRHINIKLAEELGVYEYYARLVETENEEGKAALTLTFVNPGINNEVASTLTLNQNRAYRALCAIAETRPEQSAVAELAAYVGTASAAEAAEVAGILDSVGGAEYATMMAGQIEGNLAHLRRLRGHMGHGHLLGNSKSGLAAFANAYGDTAEVDADARGLGYERNEWGAQVGVEQEIAENMGIGLALSVGRANVTPTGGVRYHEDNQHLDAYHFMRRGHWENRVSVGVGLHEHDLARRGYTGTMASATADGTSFNFMEEISYRLPVTESLTLRPFFAIESSVNHIDGFAESGSSLSLVGDAQDAWATDLTLGVSAEKRFAVLERAPRATAELHAGITASVGDTTSDLRMHFAGAPGHSFEQSSAARNRWGMNLGAGVNVPVSQFTSLYANAEALLRGDSSSLDAQLGVHVNF